MSQANPRSALPWFGVAALAPSLVFCGPILGIRDLYSVSTDGGDEASLQDGAKGMPEAGADSSGVDGQSPPTDAGGHDGCVPDGCACLPPSVVFCDDFETGDLRRWASESVNPDDSIAEVSDAAFRGAWSFHAKTVSGDASDFVASIGTNPLPFTSALGTVATRVYMRANTNVDPFTNFVDFNHNWDGGGAQGLDLYSVGGKWRLGLLDPDAAAYDDAVVSIPIGQWLCLEQVFNFGSGGEFSLYLNANPTPILQWTLSSVPFASNDTGVLSIGIDHSDAPGLDLLYDDVVVAGFTDKRAGIQIGCE